MTTSASLSRMPLSSSTSFSKSSALRFSASDGRYLYVVEKV